ncbi:MAG: PEP-utilizing enzyme [Patescibacteria group bacterium]|jgi:phosphoenolpyruvate synthase/pyruvate phosphate dikinase
MKINIDLKHELFQWGPIDAKLIYPDYFSWSFVNYAKKFISWSDLVGIFSQGKVVYFGDNPNLRERGRKNFYRYILPNEQFKKYYQEWQKYLKHLIKLQHSITPKYLQALDNHNLNQLYQKWVRAYLNFWTVGLLPELSNWGTEEILSERLRLIVPQQYFSKVFEKLSAPLSLSFYQRSDLELLALRKYFKNKKEFDKKLFKFQQNHFWQLNSYGHSRVLPVAYFKQEFLKYSSSSAAQKVRGLKLYSQRVKLVKKKIIKQYQLDGQTAKIADRLSFCVWWQDLRKFYIFWANHCIDVFLKEFSKRYKVSFLDLHFYNAEELSKLSVQGLKINSQIIWARKKLVVCHYAEKNNKLDYIIGARAKTIKKKFTNSKEKPNNLQEINGLTVSLGKTIRGKVKIITSPKNIGKMQPGDILVASMTSPDYIVAMKKALAIITDAGGMTAHAAIVSRELKIPCIVNTKIATKVLRDGDLVEVDSKHGVIKKL